ncbi:hypothetical protein [Granulosicoccus antarcticus]|uniref:Uncharacterized protein n=1 Tax=Granulosicoccus antarcticus IMCC3135 TaxID=1192854 RepID=A0A2Z2NGX2_9GAMM|nr:hypothetical protein [Granulosicoccus antarcticus]ASJ70323.1 hypothetical protein IMCC3135_00990 [Granulosicoccus antarcticus IMCC3135]
MLTLFDSSVNVVYDGPVAFKGGLLWRSFRSEALTLTQSTDSDVKMAGWLQDSGSFTRNDSYSLRRTEQLAVHAVETDGAVLDVTDATIYWGGGLGRASLDFSADLAGRAIFRSAETDDRRIKVSTPLPFHYLAEPSAWNTAWTFPEGRLQLLADDGSELTLDAGASESGRVQITLSNSDGDAQFDVDWTLWAEMLRP